MAFKISLASLVDQNEVPKGLAAAFSGSPALLQSPPHQAQSTEALVPQLFMVNPSSDNIFRHVDPENGRAAIIGLIYFSMWMGALGWDIASSILFDFRVIRETTWSSVFSAVYSIAYLLSRYISLAWILTAVTNSIVMTPSCDPWMKSSTALFSIAISATMLVFCLRTCSIWHMRTKVVLPVVGAWMLVAAFAALLPVFSSGTHVETSSFCAWHFNGLYVVGVFVSLLLFDVLCLALTVLKLNKAGWRGIARGIWPSTRHNYDSEDVKTMLVQKTTAFFAIQFVFLISALLMYVLTDRYAFKLMNIVASVAVASSMAGRIFRKAWRQTREFAPERLNRPPSYYPAWADEHQDHRNGSEPALLAAAYPSSRPGTGGPQSSSGGGHGHGNGAFKKRSRKRPDSLDFYVEGEFGAKSFSASAVSLRSSAHDRSGPLPSPAALSTTAAQTYAAQQLQMLNGMDSIIVEGEGARGAQGRGHHGHRSRSAAPTDEHAIASMTTESTRAGVAMQRGGSQGDSPTSGLLRSGPRRTSAEERVISQALSPALREDLNPAPAYSRHLFGPIDPRRVSEDSSDSGGEGPYSSGYFGARNDRDGFPTSTGRRIGTADSAASSVAAAAAVFAFSSLGRTSVSAFDSDHAHVAAAGAALHGTDGRWKRRPSAISTGSERSGPIELDERRRLYVASPPMSAGARLSHKEEQRRVYDVESVKAAARIEPLPRCSTLSRRDTVRPFTASTAEPRRQGFSGQSFTPPNGSPRQAGGDSAAPSTPDQRGHSGAVDDAYEVRGRGGILDGRPSQDTILARQEQLTPRPKTAPAWPSPRLTPSESTSSILTLVPTATSTSGATYAVDENDGNTSGHAATANDADAADALCAFRQTIEEDSREMDRNSRSRAGRSRSGTLDRTRRPPSSRDGGDLRPRTSRGAGLNSQGRAQTSDGDLTVQDDSPQLSPAGQGERFNDRQRPRSATVSSSPTAPAKQHRISSTRRESRSRPDTAKSRNRPSSSHSRRFNSSTGSRSRSRLTSADGTVSSGDASRPSTAAGEDVKPFGFGILNNRGALTSASSFTSDDTYRAAAPDDDEADDGEDDDEKNKLAHLGSVIERQYAKLAAEAGMSLDMP